MSAGSSSASAELALTEQMPSDGPLLSLSTPLFQRICSLVTLHKVVLLVLILDVVLGLWYVIETLLLLSMFWLVPLHHGELILSLINNTVSILVGVVAVVGLWAMVRDNKVLFSFYYRLKLLELAFSFLFCPSTSHMYCPPKDLRCQTMTLMVVCLTKVGVNALEVYLLHKVLIQWRKVQYSPSPLSGIQLRQMLPTSLPS